MNPIAKTSVPRLPLRENRFIRNPQGHAMTALLAMPLRDIHFEGAKQIIQEPCP